MRRGGTHLLFKVCWRLNDEGVAPAPPVDQVVRVLSIHHLHHFPGREQAQRDPGTDVLGVLDWLGLAAGQVSYSRERPKPGHARRACAFLHLHSLDKGHLGPRGEVPRLLSTCLRHAAAEQGQRTATAGSAAAGVCDSNSERLATRPSLVTAFHFVWGSRALCVPWECWGSKLWDAAGQWWETQRPPPPRSSPPVLRRAR